MSEADVRKSIGLVMRAFHEFVAADCTAQGIASFTEWANPTAMAERLRAGYPSFVALRDERIVGVIEWMPPDHVAMLFVDPSSQGEGIGRRLFEEACRRVLAEQQDVKLVRVHASRYAVPFYSRLGFRETGPEEERDGIRFIPMALELEP